MSYRQLTQEQRSQIEILLSNNFLQKEIAAQLGVSAATISRELSRNKGFTGYYANVAQANTKQRRAKGGRAGISMFVLDLVEEMLCKDWSPEQISGYLKKNKNIVISHETIYKHVWANQRAGGTLYTHLRHHRRKHRHRSSGKAGRGCIPNRVDISERPAVVEQKTRVGDWEGDTIIGKNHKGAILSLVDRHTKFTLLANLKNKTAAEVLRGIQETCAQIPGALFKTITFDNGKEFSYHEAITKHLGAACYFARPYCSSDRGLNEHTNGLVRQYYPKKTSFTQLEDARTQEIADKLNDRPRKVLGFMSPREKLMECVAAIALDP